MQFDILTLFPEMFEPVLGGSILGRAAGKGILDFNLVNIRDFSKNKHFNTDDYPYGGGGGMVMTVQPIYDAVQSLSGDKPFIIYMSPKGKPLTQDLAKSLLAHPRIAILCGHYEGVDQRALDEVCDMEVSLGDFVLTGGELGAMVLVDCVSRMIEGVLPRDAAFEEESHYMGLLEYPHYTRPEEIIGKRVPDILLSGHHKNIENWRRKQALVQTWLKRPDMLKKADLDEKDKAFLKKLGRYKRKTIAAMHDAVETIQKRSDKA